MKKRISMFAALLIVVLMTATVMFACSSNKTTSVQGKYYSYEDGVKDRDSYIELKSGKKWTDGEFSGEYTLKGSSISLLLDGEEMMSGTVENGVLTLDFWGMTTVYYKDGAYPSNSGNGSGGGSGSGSGGGNNGGNSSVEPVEPDEKARIESIVNGSVDGLDCYIDVSPSTTSIDLSGSIEVSKDSSWQLYADVLGQTLIPTKYAANLVDGDNIYYVVVNSADGTVNRTYTLHIWRNFYVDVVFYSQGEVVKTLTRTTHTDISKDEFVEVSATGYTFTGWKTDWRVHTEGEDFYITGRDGYGTLTRTIAFEAQFSANKYTITLDDNGGTCSTGSVEVTYANYFKLPVPSRTGYTFDGWEYNGTKITTSSGSCIKGYAYDKDITAKAKWNANSYQLTVNNDDVDCGYVTSSGLREYNSSVTITATPNAGYTFAGWYKGDTKVSDRTSYTFTMPAKDVTYTAKWTGNTYTITLDGNGVECSTADKTVTYDQSYTLPVLEREGYTFDGWSYNGTQIANASGASVSAYGYAKNIAATAIWNINSYYVTVNKNGNYGSVTSSGSYKYNSSVTLTASTKPGYTWLGWYDGDTKASEGASLTYTFTMPAKDVTYTAKWSKVTIELNNSSAGTVSTLSGKTYVEGEEVTVTATTNPGYTWLGWYDGDTKVSEDTSLIYTFTMSAESKIYTAKWMECPVTLEKNISEAGVVSLDGGYYVGDSVTVTATTNPGYTWLGWYYGDTKVSEGASMSYTFTMPAESKTYAAKWACYTVSTNTNLEGAGTYTVKTEEKVAVGETVELIATTNLGYTWLGWFDGDTKMSDDTSYTFTMSAGSKIYTAKWEISAEMQNFEFTSTSTTCTITDIKDNTVTRIVVPDYVTEISEGAFSGCSSLESITIPFVGAKAGVTSDDTYQYPFGYIFGTTSYTGGTEVTQEYYGSSSTSTTYYIPASLCRVTVTGNNILYGAFMYCSMLTSITIGDDVTNIEYAAFRSCTSLTDVYYLGTLKQWCGITFSYLPTDLTSYADNLYIDGELVSGELVIPDTVTEIKTSAFAGCKKLTSIVIPDSVTIIGERAFRDCTSLTSVTFGANSQLTTIGSYAFSGCSGLTSITIPDSVTSIGTSTFGGCSSLESLTIPFVGSQAGTGGTYQYPFGYIFGTTSYTGGTAVEQYVWLTSTAKDVDTYYIPSSLRSATVTGGNIIYGAFYGCSMLTSITLGDGVTSIGNEAFYGCTNLTSITIPDGVKTIGDHAFKGCSSLTSVTFGENSQLTTIGNEAFSGCSGLTSITIPDSVTTIGSSAFEGCTSLTSATFEDSRGWYVGGNQITSDDESSNAEYLVSTYKDDVWLKVDENGFVIDKGTLIAYVGSKTALTIPDSVTTIGSSAFDSCTNLTSIVIPASVTTIGYYAFDSCTSLTSVTFGENSKLTTIRPYAFRGCTSLTSITIPDGVETIGGDAFCGCSSLESITIPFVGAKAGVTSDDTYQYPLGYLFGTSSYTGGVATTQYYYGSSTSSPTSTTYYIPSSLKSVTVTGGYIPRGAFHNCNNITNITLGDDVTAIGSHAFYNCTSLTSVTIGDSVTAIGNYAFEDCTSLTSVTFGENSQLTTIGRDAFYSCDSLTSITLPDSVTSISAYAFYSCDSLTSIVIPDSVTIIDMGAFGGCDSLTTVTFGENSQLTSIGSDAFSGCTSLTSIVIPDSVTTIGEDAFYYCTSLTSVTIGDSVTRIGSYAFQDCTSLTSITFEDPNGWYVKNAATGKTTNLTLTNTSTNVTYLTSTYVSYNLRKQ